MAEYKIWISAEHAMAAGEPDDSVCLRMAEIRISIPVYSKRDAICIYGVDLEAQLMEVYQWVERHEKP